METRDSPSPLTAFWSRLGSREKWLIVVGTLGVLLACAFVLGILINVGLSARSEANGKPGTLTVTLVAKSTETPTPTRTDVPPPTDALIPSTTPLPSSTAAATKPAAPTSTSTNPVPTRTLGPPTATLPPPPTPRGINVQCTTKGAVQLCAWVSNGNPSRNSTVTVYGRLYRSGRSVAGSQMNTIWIFKNARLTCGGMTNANGIASCKRNIGKVANNYQVNVNVTIGGVTATTWFVP